MASKKGISSHPPHGKAAARSDSGPADSGSRRPLRPEDEVPGLVDGWAGQRTHNADKSAEQTTQFADAARDGVNKFVDLNERAAENTQHIVQKGVETASHQARQAADRFSRDRKSVV